MIPEIKSAQILIVDDEPSNVLLLTRLLEGEAYTKIDGTTRSNEVVALFEKSPPDLLLLDLQMPDPDGFALMKLLERWTVGETDVPILVLTADASQKTRRRALEEGASDFLTKPFDAVEVLLRIRNLLRTRQLQLKLHTQNETLEHQVAHRTRELELSRVEAFHKLAFAAEYRDDDTRQHTQRVGRVAAALASQLGLDPAMVDAIGQAAPLHDIGKIGIPDAILLKPGKLTEEEFTSMKEHSMIGADILSGSSSPLFTVAADIALTHHERWDGTGYPFGLAANSIPLPGRIVALADAFDAMSHDRPYKTAMSEPEVFAEIDRSSATHFDPAIVQAFHHLDTKALLATPAGSAAPSATGPAWVALRELGLKTISRSGPAIDAVLGAAFNSSPIAVLIVDDSRRYVAANNAGCELLGLDLDDLRQKRIDDFLPPETQAQLDDTWADFLETGIRKVELTLLLADQRTLEVTTRNLAHLLPGRHLALIEPATPTRNSSPLRELGQ